MAINQNSMLFKLGRKKTRTHRLTGQEIKTVKLRDYLDYSKLPSLPSLIQYTAAVLAVTTFPMLKNDVWGDCTIAAALHMNQGWQVNANSLNTPPTDADAQAGYIGACGFDPAQTQADGSNPTDQGGNLLTVIDFWKNTGLGGINIDASVEVDTKNKTECMYGIVLFGGLYNAVSLPDPSVCTRRPAGQSMGRYGDRRAG